MKTMDRIENEIMTLALRAGIRPNREAIGERAGITGQTVRRAFKAGESVTSPTLQYIAEALEVSVQDVRQLLARAQLEREHPATNGHANGRATNGHAPKALPAAAPVEPKAPPAPAEPRDLWAELVDAALTGAIVIVSSQSDDRGFAVARGVVTSIHENLVAIHATGDQRPIRIRREHVKDVRKPSAA